MSWDDGKHGKVTRVQLTYDDVIRSIQVAYDGNSLQQPRGPVGSKSDGFTLGPDEYITDLTGYTKNTFSGDVITALTFKTNKKIYGPYGNKTRNFFSATPPKGQQIAGFHGSSSTALNSIDVHFAPILPPGSTGGSSGEGATTPPSGSSGGGTTVPPGGSSGGGATAPPGGSSSGGATVPPGGSSGGGTTVPPGGSSGGGTTAPPGGSSGGGTTAPPDGSSGGGTTAPPGGSSGGGTTAPPGGSSGGGTTTPPGGSSGGGTTAPPDGSSGGGTTAPPSGSSGGGTTAPPGSGGGTTAPPGGSNNGGTTAPPGSGGGTTAPPGGSSGGGTTAPPGGSSGGGANTDPSTQKVEAQGGKGGNEWDDGSEHDGVTKIHVAAGFGIELIKFDYIKNGQPKEGPSHGVKGGRVSIDTIEIDHPKEYIISVDGWYSDDTIQGLEFKTNTRTLPYFGFQDGTHFKLEVKDKKIVGFHGFSESNLNSIGAYFAPIATAITPLKPAKKLNAIGGDGGATWDDGSFDGVKKIYVGQGNDGVAFLMFEYSKGSQVIVGDGRGKKTPLGTETFELDYPSEYITSVEGYYDKLYGVEAEIVTSLTFKTNKRTSPPFGMTGGEHFVLKDEGNKIVGFHGKAGDYVHQVGVYVVPITTN